MENDIVQFYTWNILKKQLQKFKISNTALYNIVANVKEQLYSIIANWNDVEFRNALLMIGSEEGFFYEPKNELIANMVVLAIRNSLLEGVSSKSYQEYGSENYLSDNHVKEITSKAIEYFSDKDLETNAKNIKISYDFYREIANSYPTAMNALIELSKCSKEHEYKPLANMKPYELEELETIVTQETDIMNSESGIDSTFNASLCAILQNMKKGLIPVFITDSFKMTTRNFEKLLKILEFILTHNLMFVTSNYVLANNYVARRDILLKASHSDKEFYQKLPSIPDISTKYKTKLQEVVDHLINQINS